MVPIVLGVLAGILIVFAVKRNKQRFQFLMLTASAVLFVAVFLYFGELLLENEAAEIACSQKFVTSWGITLLVLSPLYLVRKSAR